MRFFVNGPGRSGSWHMGSPPRSLAPTLEFRPLQQNLWVKRRGRLTHIPTAPEGCLEGPWAMDIWISLPHVMIARNLASLRAVASKVRCSDSEASWTRGCVAVNDSMQKNWI